MARPLTEWNESGDRARVRHSGWTETPSRSACDPDTAGFPGSARTRGPGFHLHLPTTVRYRAAQDACARTRAPDWPARCLLRRRLAVAERPSFTSLSVGHRYGVRSPAAPGPLACAV